MNFGKISRKPIKGKKSALYPFLSQLGAGHTLYGRACMYRLPSGHLSPNWGPQTPGWVQILQLKEIHTPGHRKSAFAPLFLLKQHWEKQEAKQQTFAMESLGFWWKHLPRAQGNSGPRSQGGQQWAWILWGCGGEWGAGSGGGGSSSQALKVSSFQRSN